MSRSDDRPPPYTTAPIYEDLPGDQEDQSLTWACGHAEGDKCPPTKSEHDFFTALGHCFVTIHEVGRNLESSCAQNCINEHKRQLHALVFAPAWELRVPVRIVPIAVAHYMRSAQVHGSYKSCILLNGHQGALAPGRQALLRPPHANSGAGHRPGPLLQHAGTSRGVSERYFEFIGHPRWPIHLVDSLIDRPKWQVPFKLTQEGIACERRAKRARQAAKLSRKPRGIIEWLRRLCS